MLADAKPINRNCLSDFITKACLALLMLSSFQALHADIPAPINTLTQTVNTLTLALNNEHKQCLLLAKNSPESNPKTIPLLLEAPCYWVVNNENKVLVKYSYEAIGVDNILLIAGNPLDWSPEKKTYHKLPEATYCSQYLQGVIIQKDQVYAVNEKMDAAHCESGLSIDEKVFYALAHNPERYQQIVNKPPEVLIKPAQLKKSAEVPTEIKPENAEEKSFLQSVKAFFFKEAEKAN